MAGIVHNLAGDLLERLLIDDALGAIPVHGFAGAWGTIAVALFMPSNLLDEIGRTRLEQLGAQALGVIVCFLWAGGIAYVLFTTLQRTIGLRVSPTRELVGMDVFEEDPIHAADSEELDDDELRTLLS